MGLDSKDMKLLYFLDEDAFQPLSLIAKKTRLSKQSAAYRIGELKRRGVLLKTCAIINPSLLGFEFCKFFIKYKTMPKEQEELMLKELGAHSRVGYMCVCDGKFDLFVGVWAKGSHDLYSVSRELFTKYKASFEAISSSSVALAFNSKRGYLIGQETRSRVPLFGGVLTAVHIDDIDTRILRFLSEDARVKYTEIARGVGLTPAAVGYRIKRLKKSRVIEGARVVLDKQKLGYLAYKVLIKTGPVQERSINQFIAHATQEKNVVDIDLTLGDWDIEMDVEVESYEKFHELMLGLRTNFPDVIYGYDSLLVFKEHTYDYFPIGKVIK